MVDAWPVELRTAFLKFVTGVGRPCLPQMESIRISMPFVEREGHPQDLPRLLHMLPQVWNPLLCMFGDCSESLTGLGIHEPQSL